MRFCNVKLQLNRQRFKSDEIAGFASKSVLFSRVQRGDKLMFIWDVLSNAITTLLILLIGGSIALGAGAALFRLILRACIRLAVVAYARTWDFLTRPSQPYDVDVPQTKPVPAPQVQLPPAWNVPGTKLAERPDPYEKFSPSSVPAPPEKPRYEINPNWPPAGVEEFWTAIKILERGGDFYSYDRCGYGHAQEAFKQFLSC